MFISRTTCLLRGKGSNLNFSHVNFSRRLMRERKLEKRRIEEAQTYVPPVEPTPQQAALLYRQLLKAAEQKLRFTDKSVFRSSVRTEFQVTARRTSGRVRGMMYEKGLWLVKNNLGGLV